MDAIPQKDLTLLKSASQEKDLNFGDIKSKMLEVIQILYKIDFQITILGIYLITVVILQLAFSVILYL